MSEKTTCPKCAKETLALGETEIFPNEIILNLFCENPDCLVNVVLEISTSDLKEGALGGN